ncbi:MAG: diguanylate cyclase response regulator [Dethiosulfovibrio peptidovorans]|nr:MAG: diguanylate cyclase response regulator [Dethiosulfovibrio peptidovorans]
MRILIAEDDRTTRVLLESSFKKWGYETVVVSDGDEAWRILSEEGAPALAVLDWLMPGLQGTDICRRVRERNKKQGTYQYILLLTVQNARGDVIRGLEAGADDYIVKPFDPQELRMRLSVGKRILELQERLAFSANHDQLTKLPNRYALFDRLNAEMARADRDGGGLIVSMVDLDFFKKVNDTYGHMVGDQVLCSVARRLRKALRPYDIVGRYGGEEFLLILPGDGMEDGIRTVERVRLLVEETPIKLNDDTAIPVTISAGVALYQGGMTMDTLVRQADQALYRAKESGRNRVSR